MVMVCCYTKSVFLYQMEKAGYFFHTSGPVCEHCLSVPADSETLTAQVLNKAGFMHGHPFSKNHKISEETNKNFMAHLTANFTEMLLHIQVILILNGTGDRMSKVQLSYH